MYSTIATGVLFTAIIGYSMYSTTVKMDEAIKPYKEAKTIIALNQKRLLNSENTKQVIKDARYVKLSELTLNESEKERELLDKLQKAVRTAVIKYNIDSPNCNDLANTGEITLSECNDIAFKQQEYADIVDGKIKISSDKPESKKILKSIVAISNKKIEQNVIGNNEITLATYDNVRKEEYIEDKKLEREMKKAEDIAKTAIENNDDRTVLNVIKEVINTTPRLPVRAKSVLNKIREKQESQVLTTSPIATDTNFVNTDSPIATDTIVSVIDNVSSDIDTYIKIIKDETIGNVTETKNKDEDITENSAIASSNLIDSIKETEDKLRSFDIESFAMLKP